MISPYLSRPLRSHQEVTALRDGQPDLKFFGDGLQQALHNHIAGASFIRQQTKIVLGIMKCDQMLFMPDDWREAHNANWIYDARRAHSKAILDREAYKQAIRERAMCRMLRGEEE